MTRSAILRQIQLPGLRHKVFTEAVMGLFVNQPEAGLLVNAVCRGQDALRPECDFPIAGFTGKTNAFGH